MLTDDDVLIVPTFRGALLIATPMSALDCPRRPDDDFYDFYGTAYAPPTYAPGPSLLNVLSTRRVPEQIHDGKRIAAHDYTVEVANLGRVHTCEHCGCDMVTVNYLRRARPAKVCSTRCLVASELAGDDGVDR